MPLVHISLKQAWNKVEEECVHVYVCVAMRAQKDIIPSVHEQTVQMPRVIHGDLIKSYVCWRVQWQIKLLTSPHISCAPVFLHHSALPENNDFPEARWHQVCGIDAFVHTKETAGMFILPTRRVSTPNNPMSLRQTQQRAWHFSVAVVTWLLLGQFRHGYVLKGF